MIDNNKILSIIGRERPLLDDDIQYHTQELKELVESSSFLILGGAGSIGAAVTKEIFRRTPRKLHVVDISENGLVELVRDIRSSLGYIKGEFKTYALDIGSYEYDSFIENDGIYDYVLNLSALKHVRSEKDPYTLMRMIQVNIFNTDKTVNQSIHKGVKKYFCVSTDKATNPVNLMGASKRVMEMFLMKRSNEIEISTARFANVAFSNGSLLQSFQKRIENNQPIVAPNDVKRYFVTSKESAQLCLLSCLLGENRDIFFPRQDNNLELTTFSDIAIKYLNSIGFKPLKCSNEDEARKMMTSSSEKELWPCLFLPSDTTGEKAFEEFYTEEEIIDFSRFKNLGVIKNGLDIDYSQLSHFESEIARIKEKKGWMKKEFVTLFNQLIPNFRHKEVGKNLDEKM